jgi:hypothetical protein
MELNCREEEESKKERKRRNRQVEELWRDLRGVLAVRGRNQSRIERSRFALCRFSWLDE